MKNKGYYLLFGFVVAAFLVALAPQKVQAEGVKYQVVYTINDVDFIAPSFDLGNSDALVGSIFGLHYVAEFSESLPAEKYVDKREEGKVVKVTVDVFRPPERLVTE